MSAVNLAPPRFDDPARFGRVAVLMGGTSSEREVSLNSGQNVLEALLSRGVQAFAVDGVPALVEAIRAGRVDRVFNILHGGDGENGVLQGLLQSLGVPYTGPGVLGSALTMDKIRTKQVWQAAGLPTAGFVRIAPGGDLAAAVRALGFPVFVKPSTEGSSVGVFKIESEDDLAPAAGQAACVGLGVGRAHEVEDHVHAAARSQLEHARRELLGLVVDHVLRAERADKGAFGFAASRCDHRRT